MTFPRHALVAATALLTLAVVPAIAQETGTELDREDATPDRTVPESQLGEGVPAFTVRPGYRVALVAKDLPEARFVEFGDDGTLYLSQPNRGAIMSLKDTDGDGSFETRSDFVTDQSNCHSMDFKDGYLYYSSSKEGYVRRARDTDGDGKADGVEDVITDGIPKGGGHPFRGLLVTDDAIYVTVTDPGNMTEELDSDRKKVYVFDKSGSNRREFAGGLRNTEKLQHRIGKDGQTTDEIWGADHGSDWFGREYGDDKSAQPITDRNPADEFNHIEEGKFYGHPYIMGDLVPRPEFVGRPDLHELARKTVPAAWGFVAHSANNGFTFLSPKAGEVFGEDHTGDVFQAQHGSWNHSEKTGYMVLRLLFDPMTGRPYGELPIVKTLDEQGKVLARPVDCAEAPDGSIVWSCNTTKRLYRITGEGKNATAAR